MPDPATMLKQDHRTVKKMLQDLGETEAGAERRRLLEKIGNELALHMRIEEMKQRGATQPQKQRMKGTAQRATRR